MWSRPRPQTEAASALTKQTKSPKRKEKHEQQIRYTHQKPRPVSHTPRGVEEIRRRPCRHGAGLLRAGKQGECPSRLHSIRVFFRTKQGFLQELLQWGLHVA